MRKTAAIIISVLLSVCVCACGSGKGSAGVSSDLISKEESGTMKASTTSDNLSSGETSNPKQGKTDTESDTAVSQNTSSAVKVTDYPESEWKKHPENYKLIAFTFDDGPSSSRSDGSPAAAIADLLNKYYGGGTFFFCGTKIDENGSEIPNYVVSKGSEAANHSYAHKNIGSLSYDETKDEIVRCSDAIKNALGTEPKLFRGAGFSYSGDMWSILTDLKMPAIHSYTAGFGDYAGGTGTKENIVDYLLSKDLPDGAFIGMHSTNSKMIVPDALAEVLPELYKRGYRFCTVSEMFELKGVSLDTAPTNVYIKGIKSVENGEATYYY